MKKNKKDIKKEINIVNIPMRMQQLDYLRADIEKSMIKIIMEENPIKKKFFLLKLQTEMEEHALPKRKLPEHKRKKNISNKYKNNQENSF